MKTKSYRYYPRKTSCIPISVPFFHPFPGNPSTTPLNICAVVIFISSLNVPFTPASSLRLLASPTGLTSGDCVFLAEPFSRDG